jgi:RecG-like helicase
LLKRFSEQPPDEYTPIAEVPERRRARIIGEVVATRVVPRAGAPWLQVTISDGSGTVNVVFTGRRGIPGLDPGRSVVIEGVTRRDSGGLVMMNPTYTLQAY